MHLLMGNAEGMGVSGPELDTYRENQVFPTPKNFIPEEARFFLGITTRKSRKNGTRIPDNF